MAMTSAGARAKIRGIHVLWMLIGFFAVVITVDAAFIALAVRSHPGERVKNAYVLGHDDNKELARRHAQRALGWSLQAGLADDNATFLVKLQDAAGAPLDGVAVSVRLHAAGARNEKEKVWLIERTPGAYAMPAGLAGSGRVEAIIEVSPDRVMPPVFEAHKTLVLP